jgi:hypothetical protein
MRRSVGIGITAAAFFACAGNAAAATFYVDDDSPMTPVSCTAPPPANGCQTINAAVTQARTVPGPNTIEVANGTYAESVNLNNAGDDGLTIEGESRSGTVISSSAGGITVSLARPGLTLRHLTAQIPGPVVTSTKRAIYLAGTPQTLDDVGLLMTGGDADDIAIDTQSGGTRTLHRVDVSDDGNSSWTGDALLNFSSSLTVTDSQIQVNGLGSAIETEAGSALVQRTTAISLGPGTAGPEVLAVVSGLDSPSNPVLTVDSSLVFGGTVSVLAKNGFADGANPQSATAIVRDSTLDPGPTPKAAGAGEGVYGVEAYDNAGTAATATVTVDSSIIVANSQGTGNVAGNTTSVTCTHTDVSNQSFAGDSTHGPISCATAPGNPGGNTTTAPASLFASGFLNWQLSAASPGIDTGSPAPLAAGESTTDVIGHPRVANGDGACPAVRDKGAYEHAATGADCSPPATASPGIAVTPTTPAPTPATAKCKKKKRKKTAGAARRKKCRKKRHR